MCALLCVCVCVYMHVFLRAVITKTQLNHSLYIQRNLDFVLLLKRIVLLFGCFDFELLHAISG